MGGRSPHWSILIGSIFRTLPLSFLMVAASKFRFDPRSVDAGFRENHDEELAVLDCPINLVSNRVSDPNFPA